MRAVNCIPAGLSQSIDNVRVCWVEPARGQRSFRRQLHERDGGIANRRYPAPQHAGSHRGGGCLVFIGSERPFNDPDVAWLQDKPDTLTGDFAKAFSDVSLTSPVGQHRPRDSSTLVGGVYFSSNRLKQGTPPMALITAQSSTFVSVPPAVTTYDRPLAQPTFQNCFPVASVPWTKSWSPCRIARRRRRSLCGTVRLLGRTYWELGPEL
jgi:hypothetical protein